MGAYSMKSSLRTLAETAVRKMYRLHAGNVLSKLALLDPYLGGWGLAAPLADEMCAAGNVDEATKLLQRNALRIAHRGMVARATKAIPKNAAVCGEDEKMECLRDAATALASLNIRPFIAFGTLLGHVRNGGFLPSDGDIDLGILAEEADAAAVRDAMEAGPFIVEKYEGPEWPCRVKVAHRNGVALDLVFFAAREGQFWTYTRFYGQLLIRRRTAFRLDPATFMGLSLWMPENPETFLAENYGDWRTPSRIHHYVLTSPLTDFGLPVVQYGAVRRIYSLLINGDRLRLQGFTDLFRRKLPADPFWKELQSLCQISPESSTPRSSRTSSTPATSNSSAKPAR